MPTSSRSDGAHAGLVTVADSIKDSTAQAIRELHAQGLRLIMATGDKARTARAVAATLGIDGVRAVILTEGQKDVAMESAGITLLGGDLMGIVRTHRLARATLRNIKQILCFAFAYNELGVPIAAGLLYPVTGLLLSPMIAAAAKSLSSVSVITNALRLRQVDL